MNFKATGVDAKKRIELRSSVLNPEVAENVDDIEVEVAKWKDDNNKMAGANW